MIITKANNLAHGRCSGKINYLLVTYLSWEAQGCRYVQIPAANIPGTWTIILTSLCNSSYDSQKLNYKSVILLFISIRGFYRINVFMTANYENFHNLEYKRKWVFLYLSLLICYECYLLSSWNSKDFAHPLYLTHLFILYYV